MRILVSLISILALAACSSGAGSTSTTGDTTPATSVANDTETTAMTTDPVETTTTSAAGNTRADSDRPLAPDFTLELGEGGSYTLSEEARPVYLVFWAEW